MAEFGIRFFLNNIYLCAITVILLFAKRLLKNCFTSRMQFNLWFLYLGLLTVPFLPFRPVGFTHLFLLFDRLKSGLLTNAAPAVTAPANSEIFSTATPFDDLTLSVSNNLPSVVGLILCGIWLLGVFVMLFFLSQSALPLQNETVRKIYRNCLDELGITRHIPIYSTAFLKSPIIAGVLQPRIFLPIRLLSKSGYDGIRYMLLHELQHYRHKDTFANCAMNVFAILYWFNPLVWYALKKCRTTAKSHVMQPSLTTFPKANIQLTAIR